MPLDEFQGNDRQDNDLRHRRSALTACVDELLRHAPYAHAFAQRKDGMTFRAATRQSAIEPVDLVQGVVLSAWTGSTLLEVSTTSLDDDSLRASTARLADLVRQQGSPSNGRPIDPGPALEQDFVVPEEVPAESLSLDDRIPPSWDTPPATSSTTRASSPLPRKSSSAASSRRLRRTSCPPPGSICRASPTAGGRASSAKRTHA